MHTEKNHGSGLLNLVVAKGYLTKLFGNVAAKATPPAMSPKSWIISNWSEG
jgi:hypothetical protein